MGSPTLDSLLQGERGLCSRARDRVHCRGGARDRGHARHAGDERRLADEVAVRTSASSLGRVDDEIAVPPAYEVDYGLLTFERVRDLRHLRELEACRAQRPRRSFGRDEIEIEARKRGGNGDDGELVLVANAEEDRARRRERPPRSPLRLLEPPSTATRGIIP